MNSAWKHFLLLASTKKLLSISFQHNLNSLFSTYISFKVIAVNSRKYFDFQKKICCIFNLLFILIWRAYQHNLLVLCTFPRLAFVHFFSEAKSFLVGLHKLKLWYFDFFWKFMQNYLKNTCGGSFSYWNCLLVSKQVTRLAHSKSFCVTEGLMMRATIMSK